MAQVTIRKNYAAFFMMLRKMPGATKEELVRQFTKGRTEELKNMHPDEYHEMIDSMATITGMVKLTDDYRERLRKTRSAVLHQMQKMGIDTSDWWRVNKFCEDRRIAGKAFHELDTDDLDALKRKLYSIEKRGGLKEVWKDENWLTKDGKPKGG